MDGKTVEVPSDIDTNVENYRFAGWYTSTEYTTEFDFEAGITGNTDIYAYYEATASYTIGDYFALNSTKSSMIASYQKGEQTGLLQSSLYASGVNTTLVEGENNANILYGEGTDKYLEVSFTDGGDKNISSMRTDGQFRLYGGDSITISAKEGTTIESVEVSYEHDGVLSIDGTEVTKGSDTSTISVDDNSITLTNNGKQVRINTLTIKYTGQVVDYSVTDASLRFGANVSMEYYDETAKYGLILGNNLEDTAIKAKLNNETTAEDFATANGLVAIENTSVAFVDGNGSEVEQASATNYQFATLLTGMTTHLSDKVTAAAYMEYDGKLYLMDETTYSLKTLAQKYLDDQLVTDPDGIGLLEAIIAA